MPKQQNSSHSDSTTQAQTPNQPDIVVEGGPKDRTRYEKLTVKRQFPDLGKFWPDEKKVDIMKEIEKKINLTKQNRLPANVSDLKVTIESTSINGRAFSRQHVWFVAQENFDSVKVYVKGYGTGDVLGEDDAFQKTGTLPFILVAEGTKAPITFLLEATTEQVVIGVQAVNSDGIGVDINNIPSITVELI